MFRFCSRVPLLLHSIPYHQELFLFKQPVRLLFFASLIFFVVCSSASFALIFPPLLLSRSRFRRVLVSSLFVFLVCVFFSFPGAANRAELREQVARQEREIALLKARVGESGDADEEGGSRLEVLEVGSCC